MSVEGITRLLLSRHRCFEGSRAQRTTLFRIHALESPLLHNLPRLNSLVLMSAYVCSEIYANVVTAISSHRPSPNRAFPSGNFSLSFSTDIFHLSAIFPILVDPLSSPLEKTGNSSASMIIDHIINIFPCNNL